MLHVKSQTCSDYDFQAVGRDVDIVRLADKVLERAPDGMGRHPRYVCSCCGSGRKRGVRSTGGCMPFAYGNFLHCFSCSTNAD